LPKHFAQSLPTLGPLYHCEIGKKGARLLGGWKPDWLTVSKDFELAKNRKVELTCHAMTFQCLSPSNATQGYNAGRHQGLGETLSRRRTSA
jgi:hypothetical protein